MKLYIREGELSDKSKVFDLILEDVEQPENEDRLCICCNSERQAGLLKDVLTLTFNNFGV